MFALISLSFFGYISILVLLWIKTRPSFNQQLSILSACLSGNSDNLISVINSKEFWSELIVFIACTALLMRFVWAGVKVISNYLATKELLRIEMANHTLAFGIFRPRYFISDTDNALLSKSELNAVKSHEQHHCQSYDPLKLSIVKFFEWTLPIFPGKKELLAQYYDLTELAADIAACKAVGNKLPIMSAIAKLVEREEQQMALHFGANVSRVNYLLGKKKLTWSIGVRHAFVLSTFGFISVLLATSVQPTHALQPFNGSCTAENIPNYSPLILYSPAK